MLCPLKTLARSLPLSTPVPLSSLGEVYKPPRQAGFHSQSSSVGNRYSSPQWLLGVCLALSPVPCLE